MKQTNQTKPYFITKDIGANLKKLRTLERKGLIELFQVKIETHTPKIKNKDLPNGVWGHTKFNEMLWTSEDDASRFEKIKEIIGKNNIEDAIHVDTHIREKRDYFVTEDTDILNCKDELEQTFKGLKIRTPDELLGELDK